VFFVYHESGSSIKADKFLVDCCRSIDTPVSRAGVMGGHGLRTGVDFQSESDMALASPGYIGNRFQFLHGFDDQLNLNAERCRSSLHGILVEIARRAPGRLAHTFTSVVDRNSNNRNLLVDVLAGKE
jgi:hypothetical protein